MCFRTDFYASEALLIGLSGYVNCLFTAGASSLFLLLGTPLSGQNIILIPTNFDGIFQIFIGILQSFYSSIKR